MTLPRPTAVIFDMDGTIVRHLNPLVLHIVERVDDALFHLSRLGRRCGLHHLRGPSTRPPRLLGHRMLHKIRRKSVDEIVEPCPGIIDLLALFKSHNIPVGLVSNGLGQGYGHDILRAFALEPYFAATIFREDFRRSKPDPEPLLTVLSDLKPDLTAQDVIWYVGDRPKDVLAAVAARALTPATWVPIGYGLRGSVNLLTHGLMNADHLVTSYETWRGTVAQILTRPPAT